MHLPAPPKPNRPRLDALTGVRFFAALHVVIYHRFQTDIVFGSIDAVKFVRDHHTGGALGLMTVTALAAIATGIATTGRASVRLFFILSGFILAYTYLDREGELIGPRHRFYINRFARIYPTYLLGVLLAAPLELMRDMGAPSVMPWSKCIWTGLLNIVLLQAWVPSIATRWNGPGWSLSAEIFFYSTFPFLAVALMRSANAARALWIGVASIVLILILSIINELFNARVIPGCSGWDADAYFGFFPILRIPEFILGIAIGRWFFLRPTASPGISHRLKQWIAPLASIGVILTLAAATNERFITLYFPVILSILFAALICGLAVDGVETPGFFTRFMGTRPLLLLGEASYAIYIIHYPIYKWFDRMPHQFWVRVAHIMHMPSPGTAESIIYFPTVIGGAVFLFEVLETPARVWLRKRLDAIFERPASVPQPS